MTASKSTGGEGRGKYNRYSPEDRAKRGTYATENGASKVAEISYL